MSLTQPLSADTYTEGSVGALALGDLWKLPARGKTQGASTGADINITNLLNALDVYKAPLASPTFTGTISFSGTATFTSSSNGTGAIIINNTLPRYGLKESDAGTDEKIWTIESNAGNLSITTRSDASVFGEYALQFGRSGTAVSSTEFPNGQVSITDTGAAGLLIGTSTAPASLAAGQVIAGSTAPTANVTNGISLWAEDVSGSHELRVRDEAGNVSTLSPHNFTAFEPDDQDWLPWSVYSENPHTGRAINVDMAKAIRLLEQITGETLIHRITLPSEKVQPWEDEAAQRQAQAEERYRQWAERRDQADTRQAEYDALGPLMRGESKPPVPFDEPEPKPFTAKPAPAWIAKRAAQTITTKTR